MLPARNDNIVKPGGSENKFSTRGVDLENSQPRRKKRGFLNPEMVRSISFWTTSGCILVAVLSALLAIWKFAGTDILWRTVATCAVIGSGTVAFYWINVLFGKTSD
jgi:hypothetical protein